ncbi:EamA family transporter [Marinobacterium arenosum]|uniref:EamA family transporter n=1 Tax=Marinobacterium arenosum TaxID=2862496 RepID=UPI001C93DE27|nr:EamA family transporter [Marinobacterium arenosum]MBY4678843.1 DMT family transporter [Marinobacterium arenosum]
MLAGILYGIGAALLQSISYICSAAFIARFNCGAVAHLSLTHLLIGAVSLLALPLLWHPAAVHLDRYWLPLLAAAFCYLVGQLSLYQAIRHSLASRVSPLLGLKVLVLALMGTFWFAEQYQALQWAGVGLCVLCAFWLSASGGRISSRALLWVIAACIGYALSDLSILYLMRAFDQLALLHAAGLSVALVYILCGLGSLLLWPRLKERGLLLHSAPAALSWLAGMLFLFACFAEIGVVFGGIVQSSRGLISIALALLLSLAGWRFAETLPPARVFWQRLAASVLMLGAIGLFSLGAD